MRSGLNFMVVVGALTLMPLGARGQEAAGDAPDAGLALGEADAGSPSGDFIDPGKVVADTLKNLGIPITLGGYFWVDTGYMARTNAQAGQYDQSVPYMQGRFVLTAAFSKDVGEFYGLAQVQFLGLVNEFAKSQYEPHTLDAFVQVGHRRWFDVQVGRFLAWEVYHRGQGIELFTAEEAGALGSPVITWLDQTRGYKNEAGQLAVHAYPFQFLKFEVAGVYGQENNQNNFGVRPVVDFSLGGLQVIAGYELLRQVPQTIADKVELTLHGAAAKVQYAFPVVTVGANVGFADITAIDLQGLVDSSKTQQRLSVGGFVDIDFWRNSIGLGYHRTNQVTRRGENNSQDQAFISYLVRLPITGLSVKAVYGFARGHIQDVDAKDEWDNYMHSVRLRVSFDLD